jgi:hypothetical protein
MTITLPNLKIRDLLNAHNQLDGHQEIVTDKNGQKVAVPKNYIFPVRTIVDIAKNIKILREHVAATNEARDDLLKRLSNGTNEIDGEKDPTTLKEFSKGVGELEELTVEVKGLLMLKMADILNADLDEMEDPKRDKKRVPNPVPPTVLASLSPVLDAFQSEKEE